MNLLTALFIVDVSYGMTSCFVEKDPFVILSHLPMRLSQLARAGPVLARGRRPRVGMIFYGNFVDCHGGIPLSNFMKTAATKDTTRRLREAETGEWYRIARGSGSAQSLATPRVAATATARQLPLKTAVTLYQDIADFETVDVGESLYAQKGRILATAGRSSTPMDWEAAGSMPRCSLSRPAEVPPRRLLAAKAVRRPTQVFFEVVWATLMSIRL